MSCTVKNSQPFTLASYSLFLNAPITGFGGGNLDNEKGAEFARQHIELANAYYGLSKGEIISGKIKHHKTMRYHPSLRHFAAAMCIALYSETYYAHYDAAVELWAETASRKIDSGRIEHSIEENMSELFSSEAAEEYYLPELQSGLRSGDGADMHAFDFLARDVFSTMASSCSPSDAKALRRWRDNRISDEDLRVALRHAEIVYALSRLGGLYWEDLSVAAVLKIQVLNRIAEARNYGIHKN